MGLPCRAPSAPASYQSLPLRPRRYYFLVGFASYVNASKTAVFSHRFAVWLRNRAEIWNNILRIRSKSMQLVSVNLDFASGFR